MSAQKYRKKPVVIEAFQFDGTNYYDICHWITGDEVSMLYYTDNNEIGISTLEGVMTASVGDFVIKGVQGEFYPCKPDIFAQTYEQVPND